MWLEEAGATEKEIFDVVLAATEAFANAVQHPQAPTSDDVDVEGAITDHTVTISVRDYGTWETEQARKDNGGRGLGMMEELMDGVRVECFADGTKVTMGRHLAMHS